MATAGVPTGAAQALAEVGGPSRTLIGQILLSAPSEHRVITFGNSYRRTASIGLRSACIGYSANYHRAVTHSLAVRGYDSLDLQPGSARAASRRLAVHTHASLDSTLARAPSRRRAAHDSAAIDLQTRFLRASSTGGATPRFAVVRSSEDDGHAISGTAGKGSGAAGDGEETKDSVGEGADNGSGTAGKGSGAAGDVEETKDSVGEGADNGSGYVVLGPEEAERAAKIVALFLFIQKVIYLKEKKVSSIAKKALLVALVGLSLWVGFMSSKGSEWAVTVAVTADKADKVYKIVMALVAIFK